MKIKYCFYEANYCVDALAREGMELNQDFVIFLSPCAGICILLSYENLGIYYKRPCPLNFVLVV